MSTIENQHTSQNPKPFKRRTQDHGDAAAQRGLRSYSEFFDAKTRQSAAKKDAEIHQAALDDRDYQLMNPDELEMAADRLLGEPATELPELIENAKNALTEARVILAEDTVGDLLDLYQSLTRQRAELLNYIDVDNKNYGDTVEILALVRSLEEEMDSIEEDVVEIANTDTTLPTEVEFGVKSKREINRELARRATLDPATDDDIGDDDYHTPIRIRTHL